MLRKEFALLLPLVSLAACTTTRVDDHSYRHNDVVPTNTQNITYSTTVVKQSPPRIVKEYVPQYISAPQAPPTINQVDQEFLQYSQSFDRQSYYDPRRTVPVTVPQTVYRPAPNIINGHSPSYSCRPTYNNSYGPQTHVSYSSKNLRVQAHLYP